MSDAQQQWLTAVQLLQALVDESGCGFDAKLVLRDAPSDAQWEKLLILKVKKVFRFEHTRCAWSMPSMSPSRCTLHMHVCVPHEPRWLPMGC